MTYLKKRKTNLNELAKEVLEGNKKRGFHETDMPDEDLLMLVITELSEAVEADRKGKISDKYMLQHNSWGWKQHYTDQENKLFAEDFEKYIKDSVEDELADALIRLLDFSALRDIDLDSEESAFFLLRVHKKYSFCTNIFSIIECLYYKFCIELNVRNTINNILKLAEQMNIDIWHHVNLKLKYNSLREYKHGKRY